MNTTKNLALRKPLLMSAWLLAMQGATYAQNPIVQTQLTSDPAPLVVGDRLYVYTGHDEDKADFFWMNEWRVYSTKDMVNWTDHGSPLDLSSFSWADDRAWAAQTIERNGKYYWYICAHSKLTGGMAIGVAVADSPTGPFKDALGKPLFDNGSWDNIDPTVWMDEDGQAYLYWGNPHLYYAKLNKDMISFKGGIDAKAAVDEKCEVGRIVMTSGKGIEMKNVWYPDAKNDEFAGKPGKPDMRRVTQRPVLLEFTSCQRVLLKDATFSNSPAWNIHPLKCEDVTIDHVTIRNPWYAQNGDGLDLESCNRAIIKNSTFDVGDDAICIKSGKNKEGRDWKMPCQNVVIEGCTVLHGHGGFVIGSEMSSGARNIYVNNCLFNGTNYPFRN